MIRWLFAAVSMATVHITATADGSLLRFLNVASLAIVLGGTILIGQAVSLPAARLLRRLPSPYLRRRIQIREAMAGLLSLQEMLRYLRQAGVDLDATTEGNDGRTAICTVKCRG